MPDLFCLQDRGQLGGIPKNCPCSLNLAAFFAKMPGVWGSLRAGCHCVPNPHHLSPGLVRASATSRGIQQWAGRQVALMCLVRVLWWGQADLCLTRHRGGCRFCWNSWLGLHREHRAWGHASRPSPLCPSHRIRAPGSPRPPWLWLSSPEILVSICS